MTLRAIWHWIDKDLNHTRPYSTLLFFVPFLPLVAMEKVGVSREALVLPWLIAGAIALPWIFYVIWRMFKNAGRAFDEFLAPSKKLRDEDEING